MENLELFELTLNELEELNGGGWGKCVAGTAGAAILGGLAGMGKTIYLGPYSIAGGFAGAVGGGLTGAAASCGN